MLSKQARYIYTYIYSAKINKWTMGALQPQSPYGALSWKKASKEPIWYQVGHNT